MHRTLWSAFKDFAILFSFIMNFVLLVIVIILGLLIFDIKNGILEPLIDGLHQNFILLDEADIIRQLPVQDEIPVQFTLLVEDSINVTLTDDVNLTRPATFNLPGGGGNISGTVNLRLPAGLELPIALSLPVEVDEMVPVNLLVDVEIPLDETQLHRPFYGLRMLLEPYVTLIDALPGSWSEAIQNIVNPSTP
ncbi:MAG: hypothetical protein Kow00120_00770 [Anaerolineae bacterium]